MLEDLVQSGDTEIDVAFADKSWDVGCWKEDQGNMVVFDVGNVTAMLPSELYIGSGKKVKRRLLKSPL